jgi:restriction endonuclease Mrr
MTGRFDHDAEFLRQQEFARLSAATVPTLESLRFLNPTQLRARVAGMLERLGYELLTPETADDLLAIKDGKKYVVAFASTSDPAPVQANHLIELHRAVVAANAAKGFYVTTRGFSRDAEAYAKTAPAEIGLGLSSSGHVNCRGSSAKREALPPDTGKSYRRAHAWI